MNIENDLFESDLQASRFRHQYLDEPDEHISVQEIEVSVPTRKRRISDDLSEEDSNSVSLVKVVRRSPLNYEKKQTKNKQLTKMLENDAGCSNKFFSFWRVDYALEGSKF